MTLIFTNLYMNLEVYLVIYQKITSKDIGNKNLIQHFNTKVHVCDLDLRSSAAAFR